MCVSLWLTLFIFNQMIHHVLSELSETQIATYKFFCVGNLTHLHGDERCLVSSLTNWAA